MKATPRAVLLAAMVAVSAACSDAAPSPTPSPAPSLSVTEQAGCIDPSPVEPIELYVQREYKCGAGPARVLVFANNTARDAYVEMGEYFGETYQTGDSWAAESR